MRRRGRDCGVAEYERRAGQCEGEGEEVEECGAGDCPAWSAWSEWDSCSASCGGGVRGRARHCSQAGEEVCSCQCPEGPLEQFEQCNSESCPAWSEWGEWSGCSTECGEGEQRRERVCEGGVGGGACPGEAKETRDCLERSCPTWTEWSAWSGCTANCGRGLRDRVRRCGSSLYRYEASCPGPATEEEVCEAGPCLGWEAWSEWSSCSATCGRGRRERNRQCGILARQTGVGCPGPEAESEECEEAACTSWTGWGEWSGCSTTCGTGSQVRTRDCVELDIDLGDLDNPIKDIDLPGGAVVQRPGSRLGLLAGRCPGPSQDSRQCNGPECITSPPSTDCSGLPSLPVGFYSFNGRPARNVGKPHRNSLGQLQGGLACQYVQMASRPKMLVIVR